VTGEYFPINAIEEGVLLPSYSNFSNLTDAGSNMRMEGTMAPPAQTMGTQASVSTATTIQPPIAPGGGVMGSAPPSAATTTIGGLPNTPGQVTVGGE
jgi:hypothetical protein